MSDGFLGFYKRLEDHSCFPQPLCSSPNSSPTTQTPGLVPLLSTLHITMFLKTALTFLAVGALSVSALTFPVARSPVPGPGECEFPQLFSTITSYHDLTLVSFDRQGQIRSRSK